MKLQQHIDTLKEAEVALANEGRTSYTASPAHYGQWANVVGMAFDAWADLDQRADDYDYENERYNEEADQSLQSYETIRDLARELFLAEQRPAAVDDTLAQADYDQTMADAAGRGGY